MSQIQSYESLTKPQLIEIILQKNQEIEDMQNVSSKMKVTTSIPSPLKDATRYRWLRDICGLVEYRSAFGSIGAGMLPSGKILDDAIDTEMEKKKVESTEYLK